jgi:2-amino-4-hydroxy-6-hydroxymethyldihydropteridine diphosphokinase
VTRAAIALGANLGDRVATLRSAVAQLGEIGRVVEASPVFETDPVGHLDQPAFLNAAVILETDLDPVTLLDTLLAIETRLGRERSFTNAPRTLDLDLLLADDATIATERLTLPHPRMHERAFVLVPLADIAADWRHPVLGRTVREMLAMLHSRDGVRRCAPSSSICSSPRQP